MMREQFAIAEGLRLLVEQSVKQTADYLHSAIARNGGVEPHTIEMMRAHFRVIEMQSGFAKKWSDRCAPKKRRR